MEDKPKDNNFIATRSTPASARGLSRFPGAQTLLLLIAMLTASFAVLAPAASANAPNPTSAEVTGYEALAGGKVKVTIQGTWTWGEKTAENPHGVPNGPQKDCNDSRIGVGYAVSWGDNTANPLKEEGPGNKEIYVGDAEDNWVHSVTDGEESVPGPFKSHGGAAFNVTESLLGETPEALKYAFGNKQGISSTDKGTRAAPTKEDAEHWYSNCGPTTQSVVTTASGEHITIGNSKDASGHATEKELEEGYPNGRWGPISHVYAKAGNFEICPVMYDPHGNHVGESSNNQGELTAGGPGHNGDNSVEGNKNEGAACAITANLPSLTTSSSPKVVKSGASVADTATIEGASPEGKLTWQLFGPFKTSGEITASSCSAPAVAKFGPYEKTVVAGTKVYSTPTEPKPTEPGIYQWVASFTSSNPAKNVSLPSVGCGEAIEQVEVAAEPGFSIEKEQKIAGQVSYTKNELTTTAGKTVEYQITVKNTGNTELTFNPLTDSKCESILPNAIEKLAPGVSKVYTCEHKNLALGTYTNTATASDTLESKISNEVKVNVLAEPSFAIEKLQRIEGSGAEFTKNELTTTAGKNVDYEIIVHNTGNVALEFSKLTDAKCENILPSGTQTISGGSEKLYTCEHKNLAVGIYTNTATITGNEGTGTKTSNEVKVNVAVEPNFTIEKLQRIEGSAVPYATSELTTTVGKNVDYEIVVKNTGSGTIEFTKLTDSKCENILPSGTQTIPSAGERLYTCEHRGLAVGTYTNTATITGNEGTGTKTSNEVKVNVPNAPAYTIEKKQMIEGSGLALTTSELTTTVGKNVDYQIVVKNTGNVPLEFSALSDSKCTNITPSGAVTIAVEHEQLYTCEHRGLAVGTYTNTATVTGNEGTGTKTSNEVKVNVPNVPAYTIEKKQTIEGSGQPFTANELTTTVGKNVDYQIAVKNTGNVPLEFGALSDSKCTNILPSGAVTIAVEREQLYTCEHKGLAVGSYTNTATVTGNEGTGTKTSNEVKVNVPNVPAYTIEKKQTIEGSGVAFTAGELTTTVGKNVDYQIAVKNTGNVPLEFGALSDSKCTNISPSGAVTIAVEHEQLYTCEHRGLAVGTYTNTATVTGNEGTGTKTSNEVKVNVPNAPAYTIEKKQTIEGSGLAYTTSELTSSVGKTVDYQIAVKNTGNVALEFGALSDSKCSSIAPSGAVTIAVEHEQLYTCEHRGLAVGTYTNTATVTGNEGTGTKTSNEVKVNVPNAPAYTIEKKQMIEGSGQALTTNELTTTVGKTVDYQIAVKNTGNVALEFGALSDSKCTTISPSGAVTIAVEHEQLYTCEHKGLAVGTYTNTATVTGNEGTGTKTSNEVKVNVPNAPAYTIEKKQTIEGSGLAFTASELTSSVGKNVDYQIAVKNTGNVALEFGALSDGKCTNISPSGAVTIAVEHEQLYTCEHRGLAVGSYTNTATVTGNEGTGTKTSNEVKVNVPNPNEPNYTIEKKQMIEGSGQPFTTSELTTTVGKTVDYQIAVKNTGNVALEFAKLTDSKCENISPSGAVTIAVEHEQLYTCEHKGLGVGTYTNTATVAGNEGTGTKTSNEVKVNVPNPGEPNYTVEKEQKLEGEASYTKAFLKGKVGQTVFYKITVKNTGNTELSLGALSDPRCENIAPSGSLKLAAGASLSYTCEHRNLALGTYYNVATVQNGNEPPKESNRVEVEAPAEPGFTVEKEQRLEGETNFTKAVLKGKVGQTVFYRITVKNTGNSELSLAALSDSHCENISPNGVVKLAAGVSQLYTCEHKNLPLGNYYNVATVQNGNEPPKESNRVEVEVPAEPSFTIEKEQKLEGEAGYTKALLKAKVGQTVFYKITVHNTGNTELSLSPLSDSHCENISPNSAVKLAAGASQAYTCEHKSLVVGLYYNVATIQNGNEPPKESPKVEVEVPSEPAFTIEKEQKIEGEANYTKALLKAKVGQTVNYKITVKNTGNSELSLGPLSDAHCENIQPSGSVKVAVSGMQSYTCEHKSLGVGVYYNVATVQNGNEPPKESPKVEVEVPGEPSFTIEKEQKLEGEANYTKALLKAKVGQTVDYKITVKNTGNSELTLAPLTDSRCENIAPSGSVKVVVGGMQVYTCEHKSLAVGVYYNVATIQNGTEPPKESPKVEVEVPAEPGFTIEKEQKFAGGTGYTKSLLEAKEAGETVDYKITVHNTGDTELSLDPLSDSKCDNISPSGAVKVAVGGTQVYTCEHKGLEAGSNYTNVASIANGPEAPKPSNEVKAQTPKVEPLAECTIKESALQLAGVEGEHKKPFKVSIRSLGIKKITFYIDGKKYKTLKQSQAKSHEFTITVDPKKYKYGVHKVSVKTQMSDKTCNPVVRAADFVRPKPKTEPHFTG